MFTRLVRVRNEDRAEQIVGKTGGAGKTAWRR